MIALSLPRMHGWLVGFLVLAGASSVPAAPSPDHAATSRAVDYQAETCALLTREHWRVSTYAVGRLVASHVLPPRAYGDDPEGYVSLVLTFHPKSATDTECGVNESIYLYGNRTGSQFHKTFLGPFPQTNPIALRDVNDLLAKARQRMLGAHPEYGMPVSR